MLCDDLLERGNLGVETMERRFLLLKLVLVLRDMGLQTYVSDVLGPYN